MGPPCRRKRLARQWNTLDQCPYLVLLAAAQSEGPMALPKGEHPRPRHEPKAWMEWPDLLIYPKVKQ
jgi:hypothetical protein